MVQIKKQSLKRTIKVVARIARFPIPMATERGNVGKLFQIWRVSRKFLCSEQGAYAAWKTWKVLEFHYFFSRPWIAWKNRIISKKAWKVLEFPLFNSKTIKFSFPYYHYSDVTLSSRFTFGGSVNHTWIGSSRAALERHGHYDLWPLPERDKKLHDEYPVERGCNLICRIFSLFSLSPSLGAFSNDQNFPLRGFCVCSKWNEKERA